MSNGFTDIVDQLKTFLEPFDLPHLLRLLIVLTFCMCFWGLVIASSGSYLTARQFWKVQLFVAGAVYVLSTLGFWILHIDPLLLLLSLLFLAFVVQGHLGKASSEESREDWWAFRLHRRQSEEGHDNEP